MAKLHDLAASDPPLSLQLAREAVARFPDSPNAPEFEWNVVKALANMERYKEAKEEARVMVKKYPGNYFAADVERHLLNRAAPPPNIPEPE
jgi:TolA-binding protein